MAAGQGGPRTSPTLVSGQPDNLLSRPGVSIRLPQAAAITTTQSPGQPPDADSRSLAGDDHCAAGDSEIDTPVEGLRRGVAAQGGGQQRSGPRRPTGHHQDPLVLGLPQVPERVVQGDQPAQPAAAKRWMRAPHRDEILEHGEGFVIPAGSALPLDRAPGVLPVDALVPQFLTSEDHRRSNVGHEQADADRDQLPAAGHRPDSRSVVRAEQIPVPARHLPRHRCREVAHRRHRCHAGPTGHADRHTEKTQSVVRGRQPRPDGPGEPRVVHRALPTVAGEITAGVVAVFGEGTDYGRTASMVARISRATEFA